MTDQNKKIYCKNCENASIHKEACYPYRNEFTGRGNIELRMNINKYGLCKYYIEKKSFMEAMRSLIDNFFKTKRR